MFLTNQCVSKIFKHSVRGVKRFGKCSDFRVLKRPGRCRATGKSPRPSRGPTARYGTAPDGTEMELCRKAAHVVARRAQSPSAPKRDALPAPPVPAPELPRKRGVEMACTNFA